MFCSNCGHPVPDGARFCAECGQPIKEAVKAPIETPKPENKAEEIRPEPAPVVIRSTPEKENEPAFQPDPEPVVPEENRPLGAWAYFGYSLLFAIPVIGFILLIVFSFAGKNVNRKNFARSYWCWFILIIGLLLIATVILLTGVLRGVMGGVAGWLTGIGLGWLAALIA